MYMVTLYPGHPEAVSYPVIAEQPGYYDVVSSISYTEYGAMRELQMVSPLVVINQIPESPPPAAPSSEPRDNSTPTEPRDDTPSDYQL
jgi:hypothetical protein